MSELIVATGDGLARVVQRGDGWHATPLLKRSGVQCVALDPLRSGTVYAGLHGQGVWRSRDWGESWEDLRLPQPDVFSLAVSAVDGSIYAGCEPSALFRIRDGGQSWEALEALRRIPSAPTWSFPPRPWTSHVRAIAPSPHDAALLLVGIELGGLMRSEDGGASWADHRPGAQRDVHALAWHPRVPGRAYEAGGGGAAWSRDGGDTWQPADEGRDRHYMWGLAVDPEDPDYWFITGSPGPRQAHSGEDAQAFVYRWRGGGPWQALGGGLPQPFQAMPYALAMAPGHVFVGTSDGQIYLGEDGGDTWQPLPLKGEPLPNVGIILCLP